MCKDRQGAQGKIATTKKNLKRKSPLWIIVISVGDKYKDVCIAVGKCEGWSRKQGIKQT